MTEHPLILWLDDTAAPGNPLLGGKLASLGEMTQAGFPVPAGFGITTHGYRRFLRHAGLEQEVSRVRAAVSGLELSAIKQETRQLLAHIAAAALPPDLESDILAAYADLGRRVGAHDAPVAVRSSGESEDLAGASFAGQYDTFLWIRGGKELLRHVRACWAGMFGEAVLSYRQDGVQVVSRGDFAICVGVQSMVQARSAGVMFTLDPLTGDRSKIVLEACWGLGEGVVKGDINPSRFVIDKVTGEILKKTYAVQGEEYRFVESTGSVALAPIEAERHDQPCLDDGHINALAVLAKRIEAVRGAPQDIEWAIDQGGGIALLQVRPETVWSRRQPTAIVGTTKSPIAHVLGRLSGVRITKPSGSSHTP